MRAPGGAAGPEEPRVLPGVRDRRPHPARAAPVTVLTAADPEPPPGAVVRDGCGVTWRRDLDGGSVCWTRADGGGDPESWGKIAGNYGPVTVVR